jgi:hypothetical protein
LCHTSIGAERGGGVPCTHGEQTASPVVYCLNNECCKVVEVAV